jgi:hypothetical protein
MKQHIGTLDNGALINLHFELQEILEIANDLTPDKSVSVQNPMFGNMMSLLVIDMTQILSIYKTLAIKIVRRFNNA